MNCIVLGGCGFIGSYVVKSLLKLGCFVRVFDLPNISTENLKNQLKQIEIVEGNFSDFQIVGDALEDMDIVVHLISTTLPGPSNKNPVFDVETNLVGTLNLLDKAVKQGVRKIIFSSSGGTVYGIPNRIPIPEDHSTDPICSYGICKLTIEKYLKLYRHLYGLDYTVLRFANPYGIYQRPDSGQGAVSVFLNNILKSRKISIWGDGSVARDYIYITDLVDAIIKSIEKDTSSKVFNIGSGRAISLLDLIDQIKKVTQKEVEIDFMPGRSLDVPINCLDSKRAFEELSWKSNITLQEGIEKTWQWMSKGRNALEA